MSASRTNFKRSCTLSKAYAVALVVFLSSCAAPRTDQTRLEGVQKARQDFMRSAIADIQAEVGSRPHPRGAALEVAFLVPFGDWDYYFVDGGRIRWTPSLGQPSYEPVTVPAGFVTDLTSIPRPFWQLLRPEGRYAYAAVVHDYLYWVQTRPRAEADDILRLAMEDSKVEPATVAAIFTAVRTFGQSSWDANAKLKKAGERRFLRERPEDFTISWDVWKKRPNVLKDE